MTDHDHSQLILNACGASRITARETIQSLWSGYGEIQRIHVSGAPMETLILKWVEPPREQRHPRGWQSDRSHSRKLASYRHEMAFYQTLARKTDESCRVPRAFHLEQQEGAWLFLLEDLDAAGFAERHAALPEAHLRGCLSWLAAFHAAFLNDPAEGLWPEGTYWHLATRPDELKVMPDGALKDAAQSLDAQLRQCRFATVVHGDAKVANFCFPTLDAGVGASRVSAVDFQYVGRGCAMKDVAYFFSSCLDENQLEEHAEEYLDIYFSSLHRELQARQPAINAHDVEREWRSLYPAAWADFFRFLSGWAPGHYKIHGYSRRQTELALRCL